MMTVLSVLVFVGAFCTATSVIAASVVPQWRRIVDLAAGRIEHSVAPLAELVLAERRIAVRQWAAMPTPALRRRAAA